RPRAAHEVALHRRPFAACRARARAALEEVPPLRRSDDPVRGPHVRRRAALRRAASRAERGRRLAARSASRRRPRDREGPLRARPLVPPDAQADGLRRQLGLRHRRAAALLHARLVRRARAGLRPRHRVARPRRRSVRALAARRTRAPARVAVHRRARARAAGARAAVTPRAPRARVAIALRIGLSALLLGGVAAAVDLGAALRSLVGSSPAPVAAGCALLALQNVVLGLRFERLVRALGRPLPTRLAIEL